MKATFLDLPAELRNAIYLDLLHTDPRGIITLKYGQVNSSLKESPNQPSPQHNPLALLQTSKQIHVETLPVFLSTHRIRITTSAWPRISSNDCILTSIAHLVIDKTIAKSISTTLSHASALPNLMTLDICIANFRFAKVRPYLERGFPVLKKLYISGSKLEALMEHLALEEVWNGEGMVMPSSCIYSVEDFQTWRGCWDKTISVKTVDQELETETRERMTKMVAMRLF